MSSDLSQFGGERDQTIMSKILREQHSCGDSPFNNTSGRLPSRGVILAYQKETRHHFKFRCTGFLIQAEPCIQSLIFVMLEGELLLSSVGLSVQSW